MVSKILFGVLWVSFGIVAESTQLNLSNINTEKKPDKKSISFCFFFLFFFFHHLWESVIKLAGLGTDCKREGRS